MKRKTAIKKLMGIGLSRNEAADVLFLYRECGFSNLDIVSYERRFLTLSLQDAWNEMWRIGLFPELHVSLFPETYTRFKHFSTQKSNLE